jgi:hypothetical protein
MHNGENVTIGCAYQSSYCVLSTAAEGHSEKDAWFIIYLNTSFRFCVARKHNDDGQISALDIVVVCFPEEDTPAKNNLYSIYAACLLVSSFFLLVTLFVYLSVPELCDLQGKCLMFSICSLCLAYISLAVIQLHSDNLSNMMCVSQGKHIYHCLSCVIHNVSFIMSHNMSGAIECPGRYRFLCDKVVIFGETITVTPI